MEGRRGPNDMIAKIFWGSFANFQVSAAPSLGISFPRNLFVDLPLQSASIGSQTTLLGRSLQ